MGVVLPRRQAEHVQLQLRRPAHRDDPPGQPGPPRRLADRVGRQESAGDQPAGGEQVRAPRVPHRLHDLTIFFLQLSARKAHRILSVGFFFTCPADLAQTPEKGCALRHVLRLLKLTDVPRDGALFSSSRLTPLPRSLYSTELRFVEEKRCTLAQEVAGLVPSRSCCVSRVHSPPASASLGPTFRQESPKGRPMLPPPSTWESIRSERTTGSTRSSSMRGRSSSGRRTRS